MPEFDNVTILQHGLLGDNPCALNSLLTQAIEEHDDFYEAEEQ